MGKAGAAMNEEQRNWERIEAGHELVRLGRKPARNSRDLVDMIYDDGLTPKEALEIQKVRPIGFLGKDILAIQKDVKPVVKHSKAYREQLAREFRDAVDALRQGLLHETTCDWCGGDVQTVNDHRLVDGQPMCLPCVKEYGLEEDK